MGVVVITGTSSGIGLALAQKLVADETVRLPTRLTTLVTLNRTAESALASQRALKAHLPTSVALDSRVLDLRSLRQACGVHHKTHISDSLKNSTLGSMLGRIGLMFFHRYITV